MANTVRELFLKASELTDRGERERFLDNACGSDHALRQQVEALLAADDQPLEFIRRLDTDAERGFPAPELPQVIDRYTLVRPIGEGGMGTVWEAVQNQPVHRTVAIKLIKPGMDSRAVIGRFESERQALAVMDHEGIAKILDAGSTQTGQPYFVMELVDGQPITAYCDSHQLNTHQRLRIFQKVCEAVQHAHQKGIIHRDLKPSNVLVSESNGRPKPKIIDFGVAKAVGSHLTDQSTFTAIGQLVGTLEYMSPEQARLSEVDIDTRSDIYSLGVLLYELLTGSTPVERKSLHAAALDEMLRIIREVEPPRPSTKVSSSDVAASAAALRQLEPRQLVKALAGDLDWVVMKSLAKERMRRYQTCSEFAADIQRFLNVQPVSAGPPSFVYRTKRLLQRNKVLSIATLVALLAIGVGSIAAAMGYLESNRQFKLAKEAETKERTARQLAETRLAQVENGIKVLAGVFDELNPEEVDGTGGELRDALVDQLKQATQKLETEALGDSVTVARLQYRMALALMGLGVPDSALAVVQSAETKFLETGNVDADLLNCGEVRAMCLRKLGKNKQALEILNGLLENKQKHLGPSHIDTIATINNLGSVQTELGDSQQALAFYQQALDLCDQQYGPEAPVTLTAKTNLATARLKSGDIKNAPVELEQIWETRKRVLGIDHPDTLSSMESLVLAYRLNGEPKRALPIVDELVNATRKTMGSDHPRTMRAISNQAMIWKDAGQDEKAIPLLEQVARYRRLKLGENHPDTLQSINSLAVAYKDVDRMEQAMPLYLEAFENRRKILGAEHPDTLTSMNNLGTMYLKTKEFDKALPLLEECLATRTKLLGEDNRMVGISLLNLARVYQEIGQLEKSEELYRRSLEQRKRTLGTDHPNVLTAMYSLAIPLRRQKKFDEAILLIETALEKGRQLKDGLPESMELLPEFLAEVYTEAGRLEEAEVTTRAIVETYQQEAGKGSTRALLAQLMLGKILLQRNKLEEGEVLLRENLDLRTESQPDDWQTFMVRGVLGSLLVKKREYAEAEVLLTACLTGLEARITTISPSTRVARIRQAKNWLVELYQATNRNEEAEKLKSGSHSTAENK